MSCCCASQERMARSPPENDLSSDACGAAVVCSLPWLVVYDQETCRQSCVQLDCGVPSTMSACMNCTDHCFSFRAAVWRQVPFGAKCPVCCVLAQVAPHSTSPAPCRFLWPRKSHWSTRMITACFKGAPRKLASDVQQTTPRRRRRPRRRRQRPPRTPSRQTPRCRRPPAAPRRAPRAAAPRGARAGLPGRRSAPPR